MSHACLVAMSEGGPMAMLFAATYPERVSALVLAGTFAEPLSVAGLDEMLTTLEELWGTGIPLQSFSPGSDLEYAARYERSSATPRMAALILRLNTQMDVRAALPAITCPSLVIHRTGDPVVAVEYGRKIGASIVGCRFIEKPGTNHLPGTIEDWDADLDDIEEFLTGIRTAPEPNRVLATVLFTDIVGSTEHAATLGDSGWRDRLGRHHEDIDRLVGQFRGRWGARYCHGTGTRPLDVTVAAVSISSLLMSEVRIVQQCHKREPLASVHTTPPNYGPLSCASLIWLLPTAQTRPAQIAGRSAG